MGDNASVGGQELALLRFVAENGPISVGATARDYGQRHGLARTTIMTMMERLRSKGYLSRSVVKGVFLYGPRADHGDLLKDLVAAFVERSLGGSLSPFVAYLADTGKLSEQQIMDLQRIAESIEDPEGGGA